MHTLLQANGIMKEIVLYKRTSCYADVAINSAEFFIFSSVLCFTIYSSKFRSYERNRKINETLPITNELDNIKIHRTVFFQEQILNYINFINRTESGKLKLKGILKIVNSICKIILCVIIELQMERKKEPYGTK